MYQKGNKELIVIAIYTSNYRTEFYLRQIAKLTRIPLKTCQNVLVKLEKEKILKSKVDGKNKYFSLNLDNIQTKSYLLKAEIFKLDNFLNNYQEFKTFLKSIHFNIPIIIFGSFAKMRADKNSDLDLLILSKVEQKFSNHLIPYRIHQINLSEESFKKALNERETIIKEVEENHIILNNPSSYINILWEYNEK
ncbi:MAG: nucleotidyltransferase domain-containing protein [Nanoarchaeota archaeon]